MHNELDIKSLWKELDEYEKELDNETKSLQEVWVKIAQLKGTNETTLTDIMNKEEFIFLEPNTLIGLNVGGQLFEADVATLSRDPYSTLAACCRQKSFIDPNADGLVYFDRDWWLFRHILAFLRSNALPNELETLKELYSEASFYRLESLQRAIENIPVDQLSSPSPQIAVTWPGLMDGGPNPLRRPQNSYVAAGAMYQGPP
ncbi:BTB/POZ protein [Ochromonadaceae sp. CCMP2298]|nr:BTB/POZ protein [Ochromonadaceae sp. CCMP2298]